MPPVGDGLTCPRCGLRPIVEGRCGICGTHAETYRSGRPWLVPTVQAKILADPGSPSREGANEQSSPGKSGPAPQPPEPLRVAPVAAAEGTPDPMAYAKALKVETGPKRPKRKKSDQGSLF